jgi:hypothetical protein
VQLHASIAVVCMAPDVLPLEKALTSRSCTLEYVTAATPYATFIVPGYGHACTLACPGSLWPMYTAVAPSVTAYSQSVSPTTAVSPWNAPLAATRSGIIPLPAGSHCGAEPPTATSTIRYATLAQLSIACPTLLSPATRKWKKGARSGVHMSTSNWSPAAMPHRAAVALGITVSSCTAAFPKWCTPSARFRSSSGNSSRSSGAASPEQKARSSLIASAASSRMSPIGDRRSSTPFSGCRHAAPSQKKAVIHASSESLRCPARLSRAVAICPTTLASWIMVGSRPCTASALTNHTPLSQSGSSARSRMSVILSGTTTVWCTSGPMLAL